MNLFDQTSFQCSKRITNNYSTSFSLGIKVLSKRFHDPIYAIYGFVRYADEIVDTFHHHDKATLLKEFKMDTYKSIENKISLNPVLNSFQLVINKYNIDLALVEAFFHSMEMDLEETSYDHKMYQEYIYGSAEVVGLMCLYVFCDGEAAKYEELETPARRLGAAFQKALGEKRGIKRTASATVPMDEALGQVIVDFSGRPYAVINTSWTSAMVGGLPTTLLEHFFESFASGCACNLHVIVHYGRDNHHIAESLFKAFSRALAEASRIDPRRKESIPSSKGVL